MKPHCYWDWELNTLLEASKEQTEEFRVRFNNRILPREQPPLQFSTEPQPSSWSLKGVMEYYDCGPFLDSIH